MTDEEKEAIARKNLYDLVMLKDMGMPPGMILRTVREYSGIPADAFARAMDVSLRELGDIEYCRVPFPTIFLFCIFVFGVSAWFEVKKVDAYDEEPE